MFNPKHLSKITTEAKVRIENERRLEQERQNKLAEETRNQENRIKAKEQETALRKRNLEKFSNKVLQAAIEASILGEKNAFLSVPSSLTDELKLHFKNHRVTVAITDDNKNSKFKSRLQTLIDKVSQIHATDALAYKQRLVDVLDLNYDDYYEVKSIISAMNSDEISWYDDAILYFNLQIKPLEEQIGKSNSVQIKHDYIKISWFAQDAITHHFDCIEDAPSWLVSTSGSGLIQNISKSLRKVASNGANQAEFAIMTIPAQPERWGRNVMTKVIFDGSPIGVFPFTPSVFKKILQHVGFKTELNFSTTNHVLIIHW